MGGDILRKTDVPALFTQQSLVLLKAHNKVALVFILQSCTKGRAIRHNNVSYLDNNNIHISVAHRSKHPTVEIVTKTHSSRFK